MQQHRRRKKRPSYGVRTVEITRGKSGFGFTISGQAPCILSCIIAGSPAERSGLKTGDFLIAVNGQNVSKALHDDVVQLIGNSNGIIKLQIAANYYSDSSDEEFASMAKLRPKYLYKTRCRQLQNSVSRAEKVVQDLKTGALFSDHIHGSIDVPLKEQLHQYSKFSSMSILNCNRSNKALLDLILQQPLPETSRISLLNLQAQQLGNSTIVKSKPIDRKKDKVPKYNHQEAINSNEVFHSIFTEQDLNSILYPSIFGIKSQYEGSDKSQEQIILKTVVGYLGTIEMPKESQVLNSQLQTIRNCIRRLRIEKKVHTLVLMTVFSECIILISPDNLILAEFAADKITFCGVYSDDKKFFGLVTNHTINADDTTETFISSSCHVFMIDPKLTPHHQHVQIAKAFHLSCTSDCISNKCKEFPDSADIILQAVVSLYRSKVAINMEGRRELEFDANMSPHHSNTSGNSSNSDSGIGFRDEGFLLPDASICSLSISQENGFISSKSVSPPLMTTECKNSEIIPIYQFDRLTVRAMPDPVGYEDHLETQSNKSKGYFIQAFLKNEGSDLLSPKSRNHQIDEVEYKNMIQNSKIEKLSPQVYDTNFSANTMEDVPDNFNKSGCWKCSACNIEDFGKSGEMLLQMCHLCELDENIYSSTQTDGISLSEQCASDLEVIGKWGRTSSLRERQQRYIGHRKSLLHRTHEAGSVSDGELANGKVSSSSSMLALDHMSESSLYNCYTSNEPIHSGQFVSWADGFSILLEDPAGLHAFREFLKKEFSEENITFWIACEQYQQIKDQSERIKMAQQIYSAHLCLGAQEPVNVDSQARQIAQEGLDSPTPDLFIPAQKQIFNLMKFDCYQRFLKSSMIQESVFCEMQRNQFPFQSQVFEAHDSEDNVRVKKYGEEKKKKSLIPWHKLNKSRSQPKCKERKLWDRHCEITKSLKKLKNNAILKLDDSSSLQSDVTSSRSSLTGSETEKRIVTQNQSAEVEFLKSASQTRPISSIQNDSLTGCMQATLSRFTDWSSNHSDYLEAEDRLKALPSYPDLETLTNQIFEDLQNPPECPYNGLDVMAISSNDEKKGIKPQVIF